MLVCGTDTTILALEVFLGSALIFVDFGRGLNLLAALVLNVFRIFLENTLLTDNVHNQIT